MNTFTDILRVASLPLDIQWAEKEANLEAVRNAMMSLPEGTDIVVLPELFSTGYNPDTDTLTELAERNSGPTIDFLKSLAAEYSVAIAGSYLAFTPPHLYNRGFFIEPNGDETFYDKRHLFSIGSEAEIFAPGTDRMPIVRFRGWNVSMIICYDLRFPVWSRCRNADYDILLVPSSWPQARGYAFTHLAIARAIENQCSVVAADRGGSDNFGKYDGLTQIFDYRGKAVGTQVGPFIVADLSRKKQDHYRHTFPAFNDADEFTLQN